MATWEPGSTLVSVPTSDTRTHSRAARRGGTGAKQPPGAWVGRARCPWAELGRGAAGGQRTEQPAVRSPLSPGGAPGGGPASQFAGTTSPCLAAPGYLDGGLRPQWLPVPARVPGAPPSPGHPVGRAERGVSKDPVLLGTQMRLGGCGADAHPGAQGPGLWPGGCFRDAPTTLPPARVC